MDKKNQDPAAAPPGQAAAEAPEDNLCPDWIGAIGDEVQKILDKYDFDNSDRRACIFIALDHGPEIDHYCLDVQGDTCAQAEAMGRLVYMSGLCDGKLPPVLHSAARLALLKFDEDHPDSLAGYIDRLLTDN